MAAKDNGFFEWVWERHSHVNGEDWIPLYTPEEVLYAYSTCIEKKFHKNYIPREFKNEYKVLKKWFLVNDLDPYAMRHDLFIMTYHGYHLCDESKEDHEIFQHFMESSKEIPSTMDILWMAVKTSYIPIYGLFSIGVDKSKREDYDRMMYDIHCGRKVDESSIKDKIEEPVANTINSMINKNTTILTVDELLKNNSDLIFNKEGYLNESTKYQDVITEEYFIDFEEAKKEDVCNVDSADATNTETSHEIESEVLSEESYDTNKYLSKDDTSIDNEKSPSIDEMMSYLRQLGTI